MRIEAGRIVLEECSCSSCLQGHPGKQAGKKLCSGCHGSGNGKRGGKGGCQVCYGFGTQPDFENMVTCGHCQGSGLVPETDTDSIPDGIVRALDVVVVREDRRSTWSEEYLPMGCLWSTIDYGRSWPLTDETIIAGARERMSHVQACKVTREGVLCSHLVIVLHRQGYSVRAAFPLAGEQG